jgi:hypothetical protein
MIYNGGWMIPFNRRKRGEIGCPGSISPVIFPWRMKIHIFGEKHGLSSLFAHYEATNSARGIKREKF